MSKTITYSGKNIDLYNLKTDDIDIIDISYGLSNIPRFAGQVPFYSVALHSIEVSKIVPDHLKMSALLHDATEAYIGDIIAPIKHKMYHYLELEDYIMSIIIKKWQINPYDSFVKDADKRCLENEKVRLFYNNNFRNECQENTNKEFLDLYNKYKTLNSLVKNDK
jgi:5'-deoxynucleotidase YfbR-like HD superfamily hydrolase